MSCWRPKYLACLCARNDYEQPTNKREQAQITTSEYRPGYKRRIIQMNGMSRVAIITTASHQRNVPPPPLLPKQQSGT